MTRLPAPIDNHDPEANLELTWGDDDPIPFTLPRPRVMDSYKSASWRKVIIGWLILAAVIFGMGACTGNKSADGRVRGLMLERQAAENLAGAAENSATYWESEAASATAALEAVESDLASMTAECALWKARSEDASATIATIQQQKATPKKEPAPVQVSYSGGVEQWRPLVARYFPPEAVDEALLCIRIESGGNPNAVNPTGKYVGLFQMDSGWGSFEQRTNPEWAIAVAANSYRAKGWTAWPPMKSRGY